MMARWICTLSIFQFLLTGGCCCFKPACDPCGQPTCCFSLPCLKCCHPITWDGCCNDCGPSPCEGCCDGCGPCRDGLLAHCFMFKGLRGCWTCGRGCGEIYCDEWKSDPPDCCDPCDQCFGEYTGPHGGCCRLGPFQRILACLDGYKYCPAPDCGPWRPIFGHCNPCGCGDVGCSSCGGGHPQGGDVYYDGQIETHDETIRTPRGSSAVPGSPGNVPNSTPQRATPMPRATESTGIFEESVEPQHRSMQPQRSRPTPTTQYPPGYQMSGRRSVPANSAQAAAANQAAKKRAIYDAAGIRQASYQR
jgi:hypothetical protein